MGRRITTVTGKGQVTIPTEFREALQLKAKDKVAFELVDGELRLIPIKSTLLAGFGAVKPKERPEDFERIRREVREERAEAVLKEMKE
ncbi:MAG: AbrB/MazE/SpoVT family DNA-binding domain-containing protein [Chloroflexi bacterium]|nr:AbrB/MazE/SpoVT family DNA-binding domain-containing protein [Chloroflexota bacterium]